MLVSPGSLQSGVFDLPLVVKSYLFVPALNPGTHDIEPVMAPGWTLNYEMFFYGIFALCLMLRPRYRAAALIAVLVVFSALRPLFTQPGTIGYFYSAPIILEFGLGVLIGMCFVSGTTGTLLPAKLCIALIVAGAVLSVLHPVPGVVGWGMPAALIVLGCVMLERRIDIPRLRLPAVLGDCSYSLYLSHGIVLSAMGQAWRAARLMGMPGGLPIFVATYVVIACAVAVVTFTMIERPMTRALRSGWRPDTRRLPAIGLSKLPA
jgi:exopolysaccharide production protein ExoZ